jgi:hypothetical protein
MSNFVLAIVCAALTVTSLGCATMSEAIVIDAPPSAVWGVVEDIAHYEEWNPFFTKGRGRVAPGETIDLAMAPVGAPSRTFSPTLIEVIPPREVMWRGRLLLPGVFDGTHYLILEPTPSGGTRFTQVEDFGGILVPFVGLDPYRAGWKRMNEALKARVERSSETGSRHVVGGGASFRSAVTSASNPAAPRRAR